MAHAGSEKGACVDPAGTSLPTNPNTTKSTDRTIDPIQEKPRNRVISTIPPNFIFKAVGLAIFTTFRAGFEISGATDSGILIARLPDGPWSPSFRYPAASCPRWLPDRPRYLRLHKKNHRRRLGASAVEPVFSCIKLRGFYAEIRIDGIVVAEGKDANTAFSGQNVSVDQILKG
ncbi:hypothetical protein Trco_004624 [Trichoderma cornu-damae]|uniref:Ysc84 actin-binding domain-containing protein n=1 Tax=Trichoderma cornu-damae TaxID=654480 RepID=A0A9P8QND7_9HYPO|nr:hypothetical protein Trco_004624 [Trichoderma cornu-damae]